MVDVSDPKFLALVDLVDAATEFDGPAGNTWAAVRLALAESDDYDDKLHLAVLEDYVNLARKAGATDREIDYVFAEGEIPDPTAPIIVYTTHS